MVWGTGEQQTLSILWLPSIPAIEKNYVLSCHTIPNTNIDEHKIFFFFGKIIKCQVDDDREGAVWKGRKFKVNFPTFFTSQVYILHLTLQYYSIFNLQGMSESVRRVPGYNIPLGWLCGKLADEWLVSVCKSHPCEKTAIRWI